MLGKRKRGSVLASKRRKLPESRYFSIETDEDPSERTTDAEGQLPTVCFDEVLYRRNVQCPIARQRSHCYEACRCSRKPHHSSSRDTCCRPLRGWRTVLMLISSVPGTRLSDCHEGHAPHQYFLWREARLTHAQSHFQCITTTSSRPRPSCDCDIVPN